MFGRITLDLNDHRSLLKHIDICYKQEHYLQCIWYAYAVFEERVHEVCKYADWEANDNQGLAVLHNEVKNLLRLRHIDARLKLAFADHLLEHVQGWIRETRNLLQEVSAVTGAVSENQERVKKIAADGKRLSKSFCLAVRSYKKNAGGYLNTALQ